MKTARLVLACLTLFAGSMNADPEDQQIIDTVTGLFGALAKEDAAKFQSVTSQGFYIFDEPESALSPSRQIEFLKILRRIHQSGIGQVIMATHSPVLMACPDAELLRLDKSGLYPVELRDTDHFRLMREFCADPEGFLQTMMDD